MQSIVKINDVRFGYPNHPVIENLHLEIPRGELVLITGGNGSGKSTVIKLITGEFTPLAGDIKVFGKETLKGSDLQRIGYVPQLNVFDRMAFPVTCLELVSQGLYAHFGFIKIAPKTAKAKAQEVLTELGLEDYIHTPLTELSGGLKQRAMIARCLINEPELLILDEPTAGVDVESKEDLRQLLMTLRSERKITLILVTHELDFLQDSLDQFVKYEVKEGALVPC